MLDVDAVRRRFPALAVPGPDGTTVLHADAPGGTQAVDLAIEAMTEVLRRGTANQHGSFELSRRTDELVAQVREQAANFLGSSAEGIVFGPNMTTLTWHVAHAVQERFTPGDRIVVTELDHDANVAPWQKVAAVTGANVAMVRLDPSSGRLDLDDLDRVVIPGTRLVAFPAASNALGTVVDTAPLVEAARSVGALTYVDAVHAAPHLPLDREAMGADMLVCSPYKFFGPHAGVLAADPGLLADLSPDKVRPAPDRGPERWQTGTASFEAIAGIGGALTYLDSVGWDAIRDHEASLTRRFLDGLATQGHVRLHGPPSVDGRTPTFAITVDGWHPDQVAVDLAGRGINVWSGHYYAIEPMRALGLLDGGGAVRVGFVHYHGADDVDRVLESLADLVG